MTQQSLADATGINRSLISRMEKEDFLPSIPQLEQLGEVLGFEPTDVFTNGIHEKKRNVPSPMDIAVAGTGYVGLSIATLLAQNNHVTAVDIIPEKVDMINKRQSPIQDEYIEKYLTTKELDLTATLDGEAAYKNADYVVVATPTNYDSQKNYFDTSAVEAAIELVLKVNPDAIIVLNPPYLSDTPHLFGKNITLPISSSALNFCVNPRHCTTIFIQAVSLYLLIRKIHIWSKLPTPLQHYCRMEQSRKTSIHCLWDSPKQRL